VNSIRWLRSNARLVWAVVAVVAIPVTFLLARERGDGWIAILFAIMPDIGLVYGFSSSLAKGQLHPRAVPLYNALHSAGGPLITLLAGLSGPAPGWILVAGLAWLSHVAFDRAIGYGLRDRNGYIRGAKRPVE
jgi:uncharacterized membrane protein YfcA